MMQTKLSKVGLIIAGYIAAFLAAWVAMAIYVKMSQAMRGQSSQGMAAEGDSVLFLFVFGLASMVPTGLALYFSRPSKKFWAFLSNAAILLALTGPVMEMANAACKALGLLQPPARSPWEILSFLGLVRIFASPLMAGAFLLSALIAPTPQYRKKLFIAMGVEAALCLYVTILFAGWKRLF